MKIVVVALTIVVTAFVQQFWGLGINVETAIILVNGRVVLQGIIALVHDESVQEVIG